MNMNVLKNMMDTEMRNYFDDSMSGEKIKDTKNNDTDSTTKFAHKLIMVAYLTAAAIGGLSAFLNAV